MLISMVCRLCLEWIFLSFKIISIIVTVISIVQTSQKRKH